MDGNKRSREEIAQSFSPWKRQRPESSGCFRIYQNSFWEKFDTYIHANIDLDINTQRAALKVSPAVVSIVSISGGKAFFMSSGTIIGCEDVSGTFVSTILTSASLIRSPKLDVKLDDIKIDVYLYDGNLFEGQVFAYDFHYNVATIKIKSDALLPTASLKVLDDSISIDPSEIHWVLDDSISIDPSEIHCPRDKGMGSESFHLRPNSELFNICPGDTVVALGRFFEEPYELMAAPGKFSIDCCEFDCDALLRASCLISKCGIGGPLINRHGEVIGVNFFDTLCTPFLPINIASKCLEHFGKFCHPWLGMKMINLYEASLGEKEKILLNFPRIFKGVLVVKVTPGSPAESAGILCDDIIVQCGGIPVRSLLELQGIILDMVGNSVEVVVLRKGIDESLKLIVDVQETARDKFNRWPVQERYKCYVDKLR